MKSPLLSIKNLQVAYPTININENNYAKHELSEHTWAVNDVSFELNAGEIMALVGESGCGKSTLGRAIMRLLPTKSVIKGKALFLGQSIFDVEEMLQQVGLNSQDYYHCYPSELSGGQQQRVAIARALITRPELVICDEPVCMLDATVQAQVLDLILELKADFNLTYLFITHDLTVARFLCDRIAVMNQGKIVEIGNTQEIFTNPQHPYTQTLLAAAPTFFSIQH